MQLAIDNGHAHDVEGYLGRMTVENFDLLLAKHAVEPWGEARADLRMKRAVQILATVFGAEDLDEKLFDYLDLDRHVEETDAESSEDAVRAAINAPPRAGALMIKDDP